MTATNISEVIGWKFNHQPGMKCKEIDGVIQIVEFPGGIPSLADQATWIQEYNNYINSEQYLDDETEKCLVNDSALNIIAKAFLNHENRIRVLEGKPAITFKQLINALRKL